MADPASPAVFAKPVAFATDYDRTLSDGHGPDSAAMQAIQQLRHAGIVCILVTGRPAEELVAQGLRPDDFDAYVVEGGCQWGRLDALASLQVGQDVHEAAMRCQAAGLPLVQRKFSFSIPRAHEVDARPLVGECSMQSNVDHVDILPPRIDKGVGLDGALSSLGNRGMPVVAIGDGENDVALFERAHVGLATANATAALKAVADETLLEEGPRAVVAAANRLLRGDWSIQLHPNL